LCRIAWIAWIEVAIASQLPGLPQPHVARSLVLPVSDAQQGVLRKRSDAVGIRGLLNQVDHRSGIRWLQRTAGTNLDLPCRH
jgi:hypothetical protein